MEIEINDAPTDVDFRDLYDALEVFNDIASGIPEPERKLALLVRDAAGRATGGLWASTYWSWMFVQLFHLPAALRGRGLGSRLLNMAEEQARGRGCIGIWLDTFSFQARPFYERHGYTEFGRIPDYPPGAARFFMLKRLDGGSAPGQNGGPMEANS